MDIQSIALNPARIAPPRQGGNAAIDVDPAAEALRRSQVILEQRRENTQVQNSVLGRVKSALADVQSAGKALAEPPKAATVDQVKKSLQDFVAAYNNARSTLARANGDKGNTPAVDIRVRQAGIDLNRVAAAGSNPLELGKIGVTANQDRSLKLDVQTLEKAFQENPQGVLGTLATFGRQAEGAAAPHIENSGNTINALSTRARDLAAQQNAQQARSEASRNEVQQRANQINQGFTIRGIASYQRTFSL